MHVKGTGAVREDTHSLAPIQLESTNLDRDLTSIKRGQGRSLLWAMLGTTLVMAGMLQWMTSSDGRQSYAAAAKQLSALYAEHAPAFEHCALSNTPASPAGRSSIELASEQHRKAYGQRLARCSEALVVLERQLGALDVPMKFQHRIEGLQRSTHALTRAIGSYRSYLQDPKRPYDLITARPMIEKVEQAYGHFDRQHRSALRALHASAGKS